jgi:head-tail adaptor
MVASSAGKREYGGEKEDKSSTGRVWAAGFHHVTARSRLAHALKIMNRSFILFLIFFGLR